ncbi:hypothetical protein PPTG_20789 [Phytophthora nicotianae INRA-310]|uniref:Uncharacterized protein n=1 Tax=Phytophthora nicotianae (strain INRA-310) TaxID=761204 RepID=W2RG65_PHYN3|nr:hypothetical protein PPTG_20789 [Phytophthora nicotianae INRA-310]ETN24372.1 hypothetical protein PPTG_20789 [Phytophthora nicotianae INRA-310]
MELLNRWMQAAGDNDVEAVSCLQSSNSTLLDVRHPHTGRTALLHASAWDAHDVVSFLLEHGAGVLVTDADGNSILHLATAANAVTSLQLMLRHLRQSSFLDEEWTRTLVNQRNRFGFTALVIAGEEGFTECCVALIDEGGADTTLPLLEVPHLTATDLALRKGHHEVVNVLRRYAH